jgi:hypothetical protein
MMQKRSFRHLFTTALLLLAVAPAHADPAPAVPAAEDRQLGSEPPHNMCYGGLENRKRIVPENQLGNPFRETTHLDCEIDGGQPTVMPDLPTPAAVKTVLA